MIEFIMYYWYIDSLVLSYCFKIAAFDMRASKADKNHIVTRCP